MEEKWKGNCLKFDLEMVQTISENLWKQDENPNKKLGRKMNQGLMVIIVLLIIMDIIAFAYAVSALSQMGEDITADSMTMKLLTASCLVTISIIWIIYNIKHITGIYNYLMFRKSIQNFMQVMEYQVCVSEEGVCVSVCGKYFHWTWEQLEWYRSYPQVLLFCMEGHYIYLDTTRLTKEERIHLHQVVQETGRERSTDNIKTNVHLIELKKLARYGKRMLTV